MQHSVSVTCCALLVSSISLSWAADVPSGTVLAEKQELVRHIKDEPASLDPAKAVGLPEIQEIRDLFEGLVNQNEKGEIVPGVATQWKSNDNRIWTFTLRDNAQWADGTPVTAQDFVYSWQRLVDPKTLSPFAWFAALAGINNAQAIIDGKATPDKLGVSAVDARTLKVQLDKPLPWFANLTASFAFYPVQKANVESGKEWTKPGNLIGNGAYVLKNRVVNEKLEVVPNTHYWDNAKTVINQVTYLPISSEVTDVNRYRSGEIDMTYNNMPIELFQKLKKEIPNEVHVDPYLCTYYYEINNQKAPFTDVRVRTALKMALDRDIIVNKVKNQGDLPAYSYTPPYTDGMKLIEPEWFKWSQEKRNEEAKKLLAEAGYSADKPLTFNLLYNTSDLHKKLAIAVASIWKKNLGVNVKLENQEWKTFLDNRHQGTFDIARAGWCADYNEPTSFLNTMLSDSSNNTSHYKSPAFDKIIAETLKTSDEGKRADLYAQSEQQLDKDSVIVPVFYYVNARLVKPWVGGYTGKDPLDNTYTRNMYIVKH